MNPKENNKFDRQLRGKFEDFRPEVPAGLWDKIATRLDAQEKAGVVPMVGKRRRLPAWWMAVAATLVAVCGVTYWYNRPVSVTYLQGGIVAEEGFAEPAAADTLQQDDPVPAVEPLDVERLKRFFAKKDRKPEGNNSPQPPPAEKQTVEQHVETAVPQLAANETVQSRTYIAEKAMVEAELPVEELGSEKAILANVPDIQPLVALEEEETMLASAAQTKQAFGLSNILNYVVSTVDQREEKLVTFSNDDEGSLKLDFNFGLAKNKKKKLK